MAAGYDEKYLHALAAIRMHLIIFVILFRLTRSNQIMFEKIKKVPRMPFLSLIRLYQKTLSPDHGPLKSLFPHGYCKYNPTCSDYSYQAIEKYGLLKGIPMAIWRVLRCNPWSKGGFDPINKPNNDKKSTN